MKVIADKVMCEGNLECMLICPEVFDVGDDNKVIIRVQEIPENTQDAVRLAVQACPRAALFIEE